MALYIFHKALIFEYYKVQADFLLTSRDNTEDVCLKSAFNMNIVLSSACFVEGYMEKLAKCILGYYKLIYNQVNIQEAELRKSMNSYYRRLEADIYQRISQSTGIDSYDKLFELLLGKPFKQDVLFQSILEPIHVLFQLRNVIAHAKEISAYEVRASWTNNTFEENFWGGYKKAEDFLLKKGLLEKHFIETQNVEHFFLDSVADYFYNISQQFTQQLQMFVESNLEVTETLLVNLNFYNKAHNTSLSFIDFCYLHSDAVKR